MKRKIPKGILQFPEISPDEAVCLFCGLLIRPKGTRAGDPKIFSHISRKQVRRYGAFLFNRAQGLLLTHDDFKLAAFVLFFRVYDIDTRLRKEYRNILPKTIAEKCFQIARLIIMTELERVTGNSLAGIVLPMQKRLVAFQKRSSLLRRRYGARKRKK